MIITSAEAMMEELGLESVSMREIARKIHYTAPTLYMHFRDKEDLLTILYQRYITRMKNSLRPARGSTGVSYARQLCSNYISFGVKHPNSYQLIVRYGLSPEIFRWLTSEIDCKLKQSGTGEEFFYFLHGFTITLVRHGPQHNHAPQRAVESFLNKYL